MDFNANVFTLFDREWALITAGTKESGYNTMTASWGGVGTLWSKSVATVYVKPIRYTHDFIEANEYFTVSFYTEEHRKALALLGTLSGRDADKVSQAGLTPEFLEKAVTFKEARATLLCKKIYRHDFVLENVPEDAKEKYYTSEPPHTMYIGEVIDIL